MPNGGDVPGGSGIVPLITGAIQSLFGFGGGKSAGEVAHEQLVISNITTRIITRIAKGQSITPADSAHLGLSFANQAGVDAAVANERLRIFGPPVTERFETLPPFVPAPDLPILQELGIPFMDEPVQPEFFQPGPAPVPDVGGFDMAVDAPLLSGVGGLPAVLGRTTPIIGGVLGGLAQDFLSGFLRAPQEMGAAQVPQRIPQAQMPMEKPSTRILRRIFQNTGVRIKLSAVKALARQLGLQAAANCLRITAQELCQLIITPSPRRRRGISGSDIRIVKRTARRFQSLQEDLSGLVSRRRAAPRRRTRHVHGLAHTAPAGG